MTCVFIALVQQPKIVKFRNNKYVRKLRKEYASKIRDEKIVDDGTVYIDEKKYRRMEFLGLIKYAIFETLTVNYQFPCVFLYYHFTMDNF